MKHLRESGAELVAVVERWNAFAKIRQDLFGVVDVLAIRGEQTIAVQSTSYSNVSARVKKIGDSDAIAHLRKAGWVILVHGWRKVGRTWQVREVDVS